MSDKLKKRYEEMRQQCVNYGGLGFADESVCHQALSKVRHLPSITYQLAALLDDMALALNTRLATQLDAEKVKKWIADNAGTHYLPKFELLDAINSGNLGVGE